jgi:hypothetical protein
LNSRIRDRDIESTAGWYQLYSASTMRRTSLSLARLHIRLRSTSSSRKSARSCAVTGELDGRSSDLRTERSSARGQPGNSTGSVAWCEEICVDRWSSVVGLGKRALSLIATHVLRPELSLARARESSKSAATSMERIISCTMRLCTGSCRERAPLVVATSTSTSTLYANSAPLFSARS